MCIRDSTGTANSTLVNLFGKIIADNGSGKTTLTKNGTNTWALNAANTYTGATAVNAGALSLTGGSLSNTAISVANGATLSVLTTGAYSAGSTATAAAGASLNLGAGSTFTMANNDSAGTFKMCIRDSLSTINGVGFSQSQLTNKLIGGWAVVNGNSFATYLDGVGVGELGSTVGGNIFAGGNAFQAYDGFDLSASTTQATYNINDLSLIHI